MGWESTLYTMSFSDPSTCAPACRFAAVVELEMALTGNPDKKLLMRALARRRDNQFDNFFERLSTELFITGTLPNLWSIHTRAVCHTTHITP